ncbi:helix-turn-helix domain-containing protein [Enterococcus casseliflavus]|uniref:helix-turn-helix domain-containing protein n=1 Tax=Enterococcus casseliflavus TaxID=37734 RepID=UPI0039A5CF66
MSVNAIEQNIAAIYRKEVDKQALNQRMMAQDINISPQLLSHVLNGRRSMGIEKVVDIAEYLQDPNVDFEVAATLFHTPKPLNRKRRDNHPLSKMVGQDKEEMERIEIEKIYEIWDLLTIEPGELSDIEIDHLKLYWFELRDEVRLELSVLSSMCNRFGWDMREMTRQSETRERND